MPKKILLINTIPSSLESVKEKGNIPFGILSIGTWLTKKSKFKVKLIDCIVEEDYEKLIEKEVKDKDTILAGLSVMSACVPNALKITRLIKKLNKKLSVVWGGIHCRLYPEQTAAHPLIDFVVYGEGEIPILELANALLKKRSTKKIRGIVYKEKGRVVKTPPSDLIDINELGIPNYELLNKKVLENKVVSIFTSRGCPHRCTFCINVVTNNRRWRWISPENVIKEIEYLIKKYDIKVLGFTDECFFVNRERAEKIFDLLLKKGIKLRISATARADYFTKKIITDDILKKMKKCGFYNLGIGAEFGSQKMLDMIKKDITPEDIITSVKMLKKAGIGGTYAFMTGFPEETREDTLATINLIKKMVKINPGITVIRENGKVYAWREKVRIAGPQVYRPYPGGELYEYVTEKYNWHTPETLEEWEEYFKKETRWRIEDYPWIKNPEFYAALQFYVKSGKSDLFTFIKRLTLPSSTKIKILNLFFYPFAKIRMVLNYFDHPFEYIIGKKLGIIKEFET